MTNILQYINPVTIFFIFFFFAGCIWSELLWVAPELLPISIVPGTPATQKGDVYSFAIILEEIVVRGGPYEAARQFLDVQGKYMALKGANTITGRIGSFMYTIYCFNAVLK